MAGWLSTFGANSVLDGTAIPATLHAKLHIGNPTAAGTANPATETTRKSFTRAAASGGATSNAGALQWTSYPAAEDPTFITLWDASSGGNCWGIVASTNNALAIGDTLNIAIGDLDLSLDIFA